MCMKNININTLTFTKPNKDFSCIQIFDRVVPEIHKENLVLRDFNVLIMTSVVLPNNPVSEDPNKCIVKDNSYDVLIRLNHVHTGKGFDLGQYSFRIDENTLNDVCRPIYETKKIISVPDLEFPLGAGLYAIKVCIKNSKDTDGTWYIQSIQTFNVVYNA